MGDINTFLFIKDPNIERRVTECLLRFKTIKIIDSVDNNFAFIERYRYFACHLLIVDLTNNYQNTLEVISSVNKPILTLAIIAQTELSYHLLNMDVSDVIIDKFNIDVFVKKIGKMKRTIEMTYKRDQSGAAADTEIAYKNKSIVYPPFSFLKHGKTSIRVLLDDILYIQSKGRELHIATRKGISYNYNSSLKSFLLTLPPDRFVRINNSVIINIMHIDKVENIYVYIGETAFKVSRIFSVPLKQLLGL